MKHHVSLEAEADRNTSRCFVHLCMRCSEESWFPGECVHTLLSEGRTNSWIWPTQALKADTSIVFAEILSCSPGSCLPGGSGHRFVHCSRNQVSASWCTWKTELHSRKEIFVHRKGNKEEEAIFYQLLIGEVPLHLSSKERGHNAEQSCPEADRWDKHTGSDDVGLGSLDRFSCLPQVGWWPRCSLSCTQQHKERKGGSRASLNHPVTKCVCLPEGRTKNFLE